MPILAAVCCVCLETDIQVAYDQCLEFPTQSRQASPISPSKRPPLSKSAVFLIPRMNQQAASLKAESVFVHLPCCFASRGQRESNVSLPLDAQYLSLTAMPKPPASETWSLGRCLLKFVFHLKTKKKFRTGALMQIDLNYESVDRKSNFRNSTDGDDR